MIIGVDIDEEKITEMLDDALISDEEYDHPETWANFNDPLPAWVTE